MLLRRLAGFALLAVGVMAMLAPLALLEHAGYLAHLHPAGRSSMMLRMIDLWPMACAWIAAYAVMGVLVGRMLSGVAGTQSHDPILDSGLGE